MTANHVRANVIGMNSRIRVLNLNRGGGSIVANIRVFHGLLSANRTNSGMNLLLHNVSGGRVGHNVMVARPNSVAPRSNFGTSVCILGGRRNNHRAPFNGGCHPRFCLHAVSYANRVALPRKARVMVPNSGMRVGIDLVCPMTLGMNLHFTVHRNNHAMNSNRVARMFSWSRVRFEPLRGRTCLQR